MTSQRHNAVSAGGRTGYATATALSDRDIPDAVLAATRATVLAVGVRRTTLTEVARRAGVSRMTLYRLVPDAPPLVLGVMTREFAALLDRAERAAGRRRSARARVVTTSPEIVSTLPSEPLF